jgi:hypothetical protein
MGNPVPNQLRAVDPYASYDSAEINKITRTVSGGKDVILDSKPVTFTLYDSTKINALAGNLIKDDVYIELDNSIIDFTDVDFYVNSSGGHWSEDGYYYVVLDYTYSKSKPAPEASLKIILPSQRTNPAIFNTAAHMLLKVVNISSLSGSRAVAGFLDYDPDYPSVTVSKKSDYKTIAESSYNVQASDSNLVFVNNNNKNVSLPPANMTSSVTIINTGDSVITLNPTIGNTINGQMNYQFKLKNTKLNLISDGISKWISLITSTYVTPIISDENVINVTSGKTLVISELATGITNINLPSSTLFSDDLKIVNKGGNQININPISPDTISDELSLESTTEFEIIVLTPVNGGWIYSRQTTTGGGDYDLKDLKVNLTDTTPGFLSDKIVAGTNVTVEVLNPGANAQLKINSSGGSTGSTVKVSAADTADDYLQAKIVAGSNITITKLVVAGVETLQLSATTPTAGGSLDITNITANYTVVSTDSTIICKSTSARTITLLGALNSTEVLKIINLSSNNSPVTIMRAGTDTIEGATSIVLPNKYASVTLISDKVDTWVTI